MSLRDSKQPWYKEPWPWILMAGPGTVVVAGLVTAWLAATGDDGLVTDDYYKQGMTVNQRLHRDQKAGEMGLQADVMRSDMGIRMLLTSAGGGGLPEVLTLKLAHPTRVGQDQLVEMKLEGQGFYSGKLSADVSGRWHISIEDPAGEWRLQGDWKADSEEPLRLSAKTVK